MPTQIYDENADLPTLRKQNDSSRLIKRIPEENFAHSAVKVANFNPFIAGVSPVELPSDPVACQTVRRYQTSGNDHLNHRCKNIQKILKAIKNVKTF